MHIAYHLFEAVNFGGIERIVLAKVNWLVSHGHTVTVITTDRRGREPFYKIDERVKMIDLGINYHADLSLPWFKRQINRFIKMRRHKKELSRVLERIAPDITVSTFGNEVGMLHNIKSGGKKVVEIHFSRMFRLREAGGFTRKISNFGRYLTDAAHARKYDAFVCLTQEDLPAWGRQTNILAIPNFISELYPRRASLDSKHAIAVGRLSHEKGFDRLIEAWKLVDERHPDWVLDIYGDGELRDDLESQIKKLGLEGKVILHHVANPIEERIVESSMLLMTSHYEGLPMVMLEAMSCGVPVVCYGFKCGPRDVITPECGIVVKDGDSRAFADSVCRLIEDKQLRESLGKGSYERARLYLKDNIMQKWVALFERLTKSSDR